VFKKEIKKEDERQFADVCSETLKWKPNRMLNTPPNPTAVSYACLLQRREYYSHIIQVSTRCRLTYVVLPFIS